MKQFEEKLKRRRDQGEYWWELRACAYYDEFERDKIVYQVIQFWPRYSLDSYGSYGNDKTYFLTTSDLYLTALLNSPLMWWHNWRYFGHMKDEALNPANFKMENLPIAPPTDEIRSEVEPAVQTLIDITKANQDDTRAMLEWLQLDHGIDKPGKKLGDFAALSFEDFYKEVKKRRPKGAASLGPRDTKQIKEAYGDLAHPIQTRRAEGLKLEHRISDLVNQAYGLTPEDIDLMWKTAPPRMPFSRP